MEMQPYEPAGFFQMDDKEELSFSLDVERPCKYIYLKPTNFRTKPTRMSQFTSFPMSISYFGVAGVIFEQSNDSEAAWDDCVDIAEARIETGAACEIKAFCERENCWKQLKEVKGIELQKLRVDNVISVVEKEAGSDKQQALWNIECNHTQLLSLIHICRCRRYAVCRSRWTTDQ
eukprot:TRINITY_DN14485_c0_g1_i2.p1 TRINITY_DN14485_c0_g1~~TRINITY_DN14485_c0_g1_i2.p1  ORF type:complete len:175 (-),score=44.60 TRINITY_DN14485_c0_g1_i2:9-533(-)